MDKLHHVGVRSPNEVAYAYANLNSFLRMQLRRFRASTSSGLVLLCLSALLSSCAFFRSSGPSVNRRTSSSRPVAGRSSAAKSPKRGPAVAAKPTGKVVDARTYENRYVPEVVKIARTYTGTPYRSGGNTTDGIDCSGLVYAVFNTVGLRMPRISWQQSEVGHEVEVTDISPGDLVFFVPDKGQAGYVSHTGIVTEVNDGQNIRFIHASSSRGVREDNLYTDYFKGRFVKALRPF